MPYLIAYSLIGGLISLIGGIILISHTGFAKRVMTPLLAIAAGAFLSASFLDILPEALEMGAEPHNVLIATLGGFIIFFTLERMFMVLKRHKETHNHSHSDHTEPLPLLVIIGDSLHNFLDGIVIALAYIANPILGLTTTLGVAAHEIPQEIGDFSILFNHGWKKRKIILINILQSLLTIPGAIIGYYLGNTLEAYLPYFLGGVAGIFLYIAASDLIPEIHHHAGHKHFYKVVIPLLASILVVGYLIHITHG